MKKYLFRGGTLLGASAIASKLVGFLRDRLLLDTFSTKEVDIIFAAFRIPDFFFYLFVGATIAVIFLPRVIELKEEDKIKYFSSFLWGILFWFGLVCGIGVLSIDFLVPIFAKGFNTELQREIANLSQFLFGSVFLLAVSGVFAAYLQAKQRFASIALAPLLYMGGICLGVFYFRDQFGLSIIGYAALFGASLHLLINFVHFLFLGGKMGFFWKKPDTAWQNFSGDFWRRVLNNSAFQINQSIDILIASFLLTGAITAFSIGSSLGHLLLSIVGFSVANSAFPKLTKHKKNGARQKQILKSSLKWILFFSLPVTLIGALFSRKILEITFALSGQTLEMANSVFFWTVLSLPFACMIPVLSRIFLANDDTKSPLWISSFSLLVATGIAAMLSLKILPPESAILGLAIGNFTANTLKAGLFFVFLKKYFTSPSSHVS